MIIKQISLFLKKYQNHIYYLIPLFLFLGGCTAKKAAPHSSALTSINIIDPNGLSETISSQERLKQYQNVDFLSPQPYQKVLRFYGRDAQGNIRSLITSYYPNGQPHQYLEAINSRAQGQYKEWHENGKIHLLSSIIGGIPDITQQAEKTWLFDGLSQVWDEEGNLIAKISYDKGLLEGISCHYHPKNGSLWKKIPYTKDKRQGTVEIYFENGSLLQSIPYKEDLKDGKSIRFWENGQIAAEEFFEKDLLVEAYYYDLEKGEKIAKIKYGNGFRAVFGKEALIELHEYKDGVPEGEVKIFNQNQVLIRKFEIKEGQKHGEEIFYFEPKFAKQEEKRSYPKLSIQWSSGNIQGSVKTWYENGQIESIKEMSNNSKNGISSAWYKDGSILLVEEYHNDNLIKGKYFRKGDPYPISTVINGYGTATLYDGDGTFLRKIEYQNGKPIE